MLTPFLEKGVPCQYYYMFKTAAEVEEVSMLQTLHVNGNVRNRYEDHVNPQWVRLLNILEMNVTYERCEGAELHTTDGRTILDFNSGYCVHNIGHNHPRVIAALKHELDKCGPAMLQAHVPDLAHTR